MKGKIFLLAGLAFLALTAVGLEASPRHGRRGGFGFRAGFVRGPFYVSPYYGYPYYGFGFRGDYVVGSRYRHGNAGSVDFNVKPKDSQIFVDGAYIGVADDFDGGFFGHTAILPSGKHRIRIVAPDGRSENRVIYVMPGRELNLDLRF